MSVTTIKVSTETRDRLKALASERGASLGSFLSYLADVADRELRFQRMREAMGATTQEQWKEYRRESEAWLDADLGDTA